MAPVTAAIVVAAGASRRFGGQRPKVLEPWLGRPLITWTLAAFEAAASVRDVVLVGPSEVERVARAGSPAKLRAAVPGGAERQDSVGAGLRVVAPDVEVVLVHDGARPFVTPALIDSIVVAAFRTGAAVPLLPVNDTVKAVDGLAGAAARVLRTVDREGLRRAQTPQGFRVDVLRRACAHACASGVIHTDDAGMVEAALAAGALPDGTAVEGVPGEEANVKVTRPADLPRLTSAFRVGLGHDIHVLAPGRPFILAGVDLSADSNGLGPAGHSDGDALTHATCDALLGAAALGDIGRHFADTDPANAGRSSLEFLRAVAGLLAEQSLAVVNISAVIHLERPKLSPHVDALRHALAAALGIPSQNVGISAKRGEGVGPVGEGRAIACDVVALVSG